MNRAERSRVLAGMVEAAAVAGTRIREMALTGVVARSKPDASPVTDADVAAEAIIEEHLAKLLPGVPVVGEESFARGVKVKPGSHFFLVDPIDGTREFMAKRDEYTVNIALLIDHTPALGVIYAPALGELFAGGASGAFRLALPAGMEVSRAEQTPIQVRAKPKEMVAVISRSHPDAATQAWLKQRGIMNTIKVGSSLKFARVAEGKADVYARLSSISEWDIAAGHALVQAAGGVMRTPEGTPLHYGKRSGGYEAEKFVAASMPL